MSAEYTCGPTDGDYIGVTVKAQTTTTLVAQLVVDGTALGRSGPVEVPRGQETLLGFDAELSDEAYRSGSGVVRLREVDERGEARGAVASEAVSLRLPAGVQCG